MPAREDFVFTIGYDGPVAIVDKEAKKKYGGLSTRALAEKGLFRAAYSSAVFSRNPAEKQLVADVYNKLSASSPVDPSALDRLFGVFPVDVKRSVAL
ncbi:MAG: hypothetical protein LBQ67_07195 [Treponema sp.]|nr:hypothetical protein [Treponema sp.]